MEKPKKKKPRIKGFSKKYNRNSSPGTPKKSGSLMNPKLLENLSNLYTDFAAFNGKEVDNEMSDLLDSFD